MPVLTLKIDLNFVHNNNNSIDIISSCYVLARAIKEKVTIYRELIGTVLVFESPPCLLDAPLPEVLQESDLKFRSDSEDLLK
ncbi:hypothetical protein AVEN_34652-1 [Araneus ventricosus]|uniref:Uncharacterized protein n=1 Tax=Araneus ventricosus TaxID=182803 RepID=A0A4Y2B351_ARAVE|nr:hypothetical protein AVEN_34652-1 [Araneus ventricosus]